MSATETSLAQPTPGPLHVVTHAPDVHTVRTASNWETASCRTKANAALYAASPCLLAALETMYEYACDGQVPSSGSLLAVRAVIAKARGEEQP